MSDNMHSFLDRLRGVEQKGKDADLADYLENLMDDRAASSAMKSSTKAASRRHVRGSVTPPSSSSKRKQMGRHLGPISDAASVSSRESLSTISSSTSKYARETEAGIDDSVTAKLKSVTNKTKINSTLLSPMASQGIEESYSAGFGGGINIVSETERVLDNLHDKPLVQQENDTAALISDIVKGSKLLSAGMAGDTGTFHEIGTGQLPPHLQAFKRGFDKLQKTKVSLPTITSLVNNNHVPPGSQSPLGPQTSLKKKLSLLPNPNEEELEAVDKIIEDSRKIQRGSIYASISEDAIKTRIQSYSGSVKKDNESQKAATESAEVEGKQPDKSEDIDEDALLELYYNNDERDYTNLNAEERVKALEIIRVERAEAQEAMEVAEKKRLANDERRRQELQSAQERAEKMANKLLFKNATFKTNNDGNIILDEGSSSFFRNMKNRMQEQIIKDAMVKRLEEEESEADAAAKRLEEFRREQETIASRQATAEGKESDTIVRDAQGRIVDSDSDEDDEDDYCDTLPSLAQPSGAADSYATKTSGGTRKQSIAQIMLKEESSLTKKAEVKDLLGEMRASDSAAPAPKRKKGMSKKGDTSASHIKAGATKTKLDMYKSPVFTASHKLPPKSPNKRSLEELLKPAELTGGPLVRGTVEYGLPLGLQLHGSGRNVPFNMSDVMSMQQYLADSPERVRPKLGITEQGEEPLSPRAAAEVAKMNASKPRKQALGSHPLDSRQRLPSPPESPRTVEKKLGDIDEGVFVGASEYKDDKTTAERIYRKTSKKEKMAATTILTRYQKFERQHRSQKEKSDKESSEREEWMEEYKLALHDDMGIDLDQEFLAKRLAERAIRLMMFYILEVQLKNSFTLLKDQTRRVSNARIEKAARIINRIGRGMIARAMVRYKKRILKERNELQHSSHYKLIKLQNKMAKVITRSIRLYGRLRVIKGKLKKRRAATVIQRLARGVAGRKRAEEQRRWIAWLHWNATMIQCSFRQHLARRKVELYRKIEMVKGIMAEWEQIKKEKMLQLQLAGAANTIRHYYRGYKIRVKLKTIIFWNRWEKAISLQRFTRGHAGRKIAKNLLRIKLAKEKTVFDAAQIMQKRVRGINARIRFAAMIHEKKKERARRRMLKAKYLEGRENMMDANNLKAFAIGTLRSMMPFRYILLWARALIIQRVYRGYRGRRMVFIRRIKRRIRQDNAYYFGKEQGAKHFQRIFRGFRIRRGLVRELRLISAVKIQCFVRQYIARQVKTFHKVKLDAIATLGKNIYLMMRFKKNMRNRAANKKVAKQTIIIQRLWRRALGRKRTNELKTQKRAEFEKSGVIDLKISYLLSQIQLRILNESIARDIGASSSYDACGEECPTLGPIQALFLSAVGPKARTKKEDLLANKLDNTNWSKWLQRIKGVTAKRPPPRQEAPPKVYEYCTFSLLESCLDGTIGTVRGGNKQLSSTEVDMIFTKAKSDPSHATLSYFEFLQGLQILSEQYFFDYEQEIKDAEASDKLARELLSMQLGSVSANSSVALEPRDRLKSEQIDENEESEKESDDSDGDTQPFSEEARKQLALLSRQKDKEDVSKSKTRGKGRGKGRNKADEDLEDDNKLGVIMMMKMYNSCRQEPWFIPVANWLETESRARLGMYCKRMQNLFWHMKAGVFRTLVRDRRAAIALHEKHMRYATVVQKYARRMIYKLRVARMAQSYLIKYIPDIGHPYWYNPSTKVSKTTKPALLLEMDCLSISMPPQGLEFVVKCSACQTEEATVNCEECEDSYCRNCFDDLHCKGTRRSHHRLRIPKCAYCKYQMACRTCLTCITNKPEPGSPLELMKETERGTMCDTCFNHSHNEHEIERQHAPDDIKLAAKNIFEKSRAAYLVVQQLRLRLKTTHKYLNLVQECEECLSRSASWRCLDCQQVYCNRCLLGLHSMGGPFAQHKGERLPYYSPEMHQSYLSDQRTKKFQSRMEDVNKIWAKRLEELKLKSSIQIQSWWRMIRGSRVGLQHMLAQRKAQRRSWRQRQAENVIRNTRKFKILQFLGYAPPLASDTKEEKVLNRISIFGKQFAREYIYQNRDDFGHYKTVTKTRNKVGKMVSKVTYARKGIPRAGFDVGTIDELHKQARSGGFRLPGYVKVKRGDARVDTTCNLEELVSPGMLVKVGPGYFKIRSVKSDHVTLDRTWRFPRNRTGDEVMYRLPVYADESHRRYYQFLYWGTNYAISNPVSQFYFSLHQSVFTAAATWGERFMMLCKKFGFRQGAKNWQKYVTQQERRARWARNLRNGEDDIADLGELTKSGKKADAKKEKKERKPKKVKKTKDAQISPEAEAESGSASAPASPSTVAAQKAEEAAAEAAAEEEAELAAFMDDEVDYDDLDEGPDEDEDQRDFTKPWVANDEEVAARAAREALMTREELASTAGEWSEHVDPMTENVYWVHDETLEMVMMMPASMRMEIVLREEEEKNRKDMEDAIKRMTKSSGPSASKGKAVFKKKR
eukprot:GSChrysophyteH1.ASY1.ANO1.1572.1 assembled CDS